MTTKTVPEEVTVEKAEVPSVKRHYKQRQPKEAAKSESKELGAFTETQKTIQVRLARIIADRSEALNQLTEAQINYSAAKARVDRLDAERRDLIEFATQINNIGQSPVPVYQQSVPTVVSPLTVGSGVSPLTVGQQNQMQAQPAWTTQQYGSLPAQRQTQATSMNDQSVNVAYASTSDINSL